MQVRKFDGSASDPVSRPGTSRVRATVLQLPGAVARQLTAEQIAARFHGMPAVLDRPTGVVALHFDTDAQIDEHAADEPILFVVVEGSGFVNVSASETESCPGATAACALLCKHAHGDSCSVHDDCVGETAVSAGDSVLWPAGLSHKAWTTSETMVALAIHFGRES